MTATLAPPPPITAVIEEPLDDCSPEVKLAAVLHVNGADLPASAGQVTEQMSRGDKVHCWLLAGVKRAISRLNEAVEAYEKDQGK